MMGQQKVDQGQLFYLFNLEGRIPTHHLLRRINPVGLCEEVELHLAYRWFCRLDHLSRPERLYRSLPQQKEVK